MTTIEFSSFEKFSLISISYLTVETSIFRRLVKLFAVRYPTLRPQNVRKWRSKGRENDWIVCSSGTEELKPHLETRQLANETNEQP